MVKKINYLGILNITQKNFENIKIFLKTWKLAFVMNDGKRLIHVFTIQKRDYAILFIIYNDIHQNLIKTNKNH